MTSQRMLAVAAISLVGISLVTTANWAADQMRDQEKQTDLQVHHKLPEKPLKVYQARHDRYLKLPSFGSLEGIATPSPGND